jgi:hypothetical protein
LQLRRANLTFVERSIGADRNVSNATFRTGAATVFAGDNLFRGYAMYAINDAGQIFAIDDWAR